MPVDEEGAEIGATDVGVELGTVVAMADTGNFRSGIPQLKQ